jgi:hypothetical protein
MTWLLLFLVATPVVGGVFILAMSIHRVPHEKFGIVYRRFERAHPEDDQFEVSAHDSPGFQAKRQKSPTPRPTEFDSETASSCH